MLWEFKTKKKNKNHDCGLSPVTRPNQTILGSLMSPSVKQSCLLNTIRFILAATEDDGDELLGIWLLHESIRMQVKHKNATNAVSL